MTRKALALAVFACFPLANSTVLWAQAAPETPPTSAKPADKKAKDAVAPESVEAIVVKAQFIGAGAESAMKLDIPVRDTPFSVSSYTGSFMKAIETTNIADMYNYMTGVKRNGNTGYDLNIRGFKTSGNDRNAIMVDGLPGLGVRFGSPPTIGVDRVEVVKGPASVLYGNAQPGGFVNMISKKPKSSQAALIELRGTGYSGAGLGLGDANGYDAAVDVTGPIDEEGRFLYRLIGQKTDKDTFRTNAYNNGTYIAPSLTWNITDATALTVAVEQRESTSAYDTFLVAPNRDISRIAKITTRYQEPSDTLKEKGETLTVSFSHTFANDAKFSAAIRSVRQQDDASGFDVNSILTATNSTCRTSAGIVTGANLCLNRRARGQHNERQYDFYDTNFNLPFKTGPVGHKVLIGVNGGKETADFDRLQFNVLTTAQNGNISIYDPVYGVVGPLSSYAPFATGRAADLTHRFTELKSFGVYLTDLMTLSEHWKATVGVRRAKEDQNSTELRVAGTPPSSKSNSKVLPMVGLLYQPTREWTIYTSYSTSIVPVPTAAQDIFGRNPFNPESAKQVEAGIKAELMGGKLNATLAVFRIQKKDAINSFACNTVTGATATGTCAEQIGAEEAKGLEFELNARPAKNWQLTTGYAYSDAKVTASKDAAQVGARLTNNAKQNVNVWSRYDFDGALQGLGLGVGLVYVGDRVGFIPTTNATTRVVDSRLMPLPSYAVMDLGVYYNTGRYAFTLKVGNVTDRTYYESAGFTGDINIVSGIPRNISLSMRANF